MVSRLRSPGLFAVLLLTATTALYLPTLGYPFVFEDLNDLPGLTSTLSAFESGATNPARTLTMLSFALSDWLTPDHPSGFHYVSVVLHLVNVLLVLLVGWLVLPAWGAVIAAGVFALHPVQVEAVAYVSARADLVAGAGVLLALLSAAVGTLAGAICGVVFACLGKEAAVMAWGVVPVWASVAAPAFPIRKFLVIAQSLALVGAVVFLSRVTHLSVTMDPGHIGRTAWSVLRLSLLIVLPFGQSIDHDWHGASPVLQAASIAILAVLTIAAVVSLRKPSWLAVAWLGTMIWVAPRFVMVTPEGLHERHLYIPLIGWALAVGAWLTSPVERGTPVHGS